MSAKRILILTNRVPYPLNDGGNMAMHAMIYGYQRMGWEVFLLSMNTVRHHIEDETLESIYQDIYGFKTIDVDNRVTSIQLVQNFLLSKDPNHADRFYDVIFEQAVISTIQDFSPDVIQMESVFLATYLGVIKQNCNALNVLRMHNVEYQVWDRLAQQTKNPLKKFYLSDLASRIEKFEERVWQQYDLLLPITEVDALAVKDLDVPLHTTPFGVDLNDIKPNEGEQWVGYHLGAMDWLPNQEGIKWFLQDVWPFIQRDVPEFKFHFAGRNMPVEFYQNVPEGVVCEGMVPSADEFIADKKILIVPIMSGGGIRVKILEAMAAGKVIISTAVGMQGIDAIPQKHYLQADTAEEMLEEIKWCMNNKHAAEIMAEKAQAYVKQHFSVNVIAKELDKKVCQLLK